MHTDWSTPWDGAPPEAERHRLFAAYALEVAMQERPLLIPFLTRRGAKVIARPYGFCYQFAGAQSWIDCPEIGARLVLLPWVEADETAH